MQPISIELENLKQERQTEETNLRLYREQADIIRQELRNQITTLNETKQRLSSEVDVLNMEKGLLKTSINTLRQDKQTATISEDSRLQPLRQEKRDLEAETSLLKGELLYLKGEIQTATTLLENTKKGAVENVQLQQEALDEYDETVEAKEKLEKEIARKTKSLSSLKEEEKSLNIAIEGLKLSMAETKSEMDTLYHKDENRRNSKEQQYADKLYELEQKQFKAEKATKEAVRKMEECNREIRERYERVEKAEKRLEGKLKRFNLMADAQKQGKITNFTI